MPLGDGTFVSPVGVRYGIDSDDRFRTVVDHVLDHTYEQPGRPGAHGVFTTADPILTVDAAWLRRVEDTSPVPQPNGNTLYRVNMGQRVGLLSGTDGGSRTATWVAVVVNSEDSAVLVSAFPIPQP